MRAVLHRPRTVARHVRFNRARLRYYRRQDLLRAAQLGRAALLVVVDIVQIDVCHGILIVGRRLHRRSVVVVTAIPLLDAVGILEGTCRRQHLYRVTVIVETADGRDRLRFLIALVYRRG